MSKNTYLPPDVLELEDSIDMGTPQLDDYKRLPTLTSKHIFRVRKEDLTLFFEKKNMRKPDNQGECRTSLNILKDCGYNKGLCRLLNTHKETGIIGDKKDIERRQKLFGKHQIALPKVQTFETLLSRQFEDTNVIFLIWVSTLYLVFSIFSPSATAYIESLTIYSGLLFAALISATCDWLKENQYLKLKDEINNQMVTVYRGAYGTSLSIKIRDLVVGDIVDIQQGDRVPADCILIEEMNVTVDQGMYQADQVKVAKGASEIQKDGQTIYDNHTDHPDPFLLSDSKVMTGQGKAIVCCVGENTLLARNRKPKDLIIEEQFTFLEEKLEKTARQITKYAMFATFISVVSQLIFLMVVVMTSEQQLFSNETLLKVGKIAIIAVVLMIVAIPEGLPLAVSIAMALSINSLKKDEILIKNLESVQTCAMLHDVCVGKTGTLTKGRMNVVKFHFADEIMSKKNEEDEQKPQYFKQKLEIKVEWRDIIKESIICNTDVRIEINNYDLKYEPCGTAIEVGMIKFLMDNQYDIQNEFIERNQQQPKVVQLPFDQTLKRKVVVRNIQYNKDFYRVYVKGAPEYIIELCQKTLSNTSEPKSFDEDTKFQILNNVVSEEMAKEGLKVLSYAYKDILVEDYESIRMQIPDQESQEFRDELEKDLIYLATFGMDDPLRANIEESIQYIKYGQLDKHGDQVDGEQVNIRMITGDHIETAKAVALRTGIIKAEDLNKKEIAMTGEEFRRQIQSYRKIWDSNTNEYRVEFTQQKEFDNVKKKLKIIARATAEDKFLLVAGIKQKGGLVGMTGDSIADAEALKKADVGLCMGNGCDVAKDNSDLVILDNDFVSIYRAVKWGRAIFDNVRKFIQFQLTVNIVICSITILGGCTVGHNPLNVVQMLWTNLIMDILGAIAIGTEPYNIKQGKSNRISRRDKILLPEIWRQVLIQSLYQILVMIFLMYAGSFIFFEEAFNPITEPLRNETGNPTNRLVLDTICFHTFILMNLFNMVNCRVVEADNIDVFSTLFNNSTFWIVFLFEFGIQHLMVNAAYTTLGSALLGTAPLTSGQTALCWGLGAFSLVVNVILKQIPLENFQFVRFIDLETENKDEFINKYMSKTQESYQKSVNQFLEQE